MEYGLPGLGGRLRRARLESGLSKVDVSEAIGACTSTTIHRWESSWSLVPGDALIQLSDLYNKPIRWFLTIENSDLGPPTNGDTEGTGPG